MALCSCQSARCRSVLLEIKEIERHAVTHAVSASRQNARFSEVAARCHGAIKRQTYLAIKQTNFQPLLAACAAPRGPDFTENVSFSVKVRNQDWRNAPDAPRPPGPRPCHASPLPWCPSLAAVGAPGVTAAAEIRRDL